MLCRIYCSSYPVCVLEEVSYSLPGRNEEPGCLEGSPRIVCGEQLRDVDIGLIEKRCIGHCSVEDGASIAWSGVHITPGGHKKWWGTPHWDWWNWYSSHTMIKRNGSIVVNLQERKRNRHPTLAVKEFILKGYHYIVPNCTHRCWAYIDVAVTAVKVSETREERNKSRSTIVIPS